MKHDLNQKSVKACVQAVPALLLLIGTFSLVTQASAQVGCAGSGACTNPVPAVNVTGTWTDGYATWNVTSSSGSMSGSVTVPNPVGGSCPNVTYSVSGSISPSTQTDYVQGYTSMTWVASSPSPSSACGGWVPVATNTYTGTIYNDGNDSASGTWSQTGGGSGSFTLSKSPRDIPSSESSRAVGFSTGLLATVGQFRQTLNADSGLTDIFKGRQVTEATGTTTPHYDNCWFEGSTVPKWTDVSGGSWNVGYYAVDSPYILTLNEWVDDYIGWNSTQVDYYRGRLLPASFPCGARVPQAMSILINGTTGSTSLYRTLTLGSDIYQTTQVIVYRGDVSQTASY